MLGCQLRLFLLYISLTPVGQYTGSGSSEGPPAWEEAHLCVSS